PTTASPAPRPKIPKWRRKRRPRLSPASCGSTPMTSPKKPKSSSNTSASSSATNEPEPRQLYELRARIYATHIVHEIEVEQFAAAFFKAGQKETPTGHAVMNSIIDKAVGRFGDAAEEAQQEM